MPSSRSGQAEGALPAGEPTPAFGWHRDTADFLVVGVGASAGGPEACKRFLTALPSNNGMAFILVQRVGPARNSMMVDLLASHTSLTVTEAADGMTLERDHLYIVSPGTYLSIVEGVLRVSMPLAGHGARQPFDWVPEPMAVLDSRP